MKTKILAAGTVLLLAGSQLLKADDVTINNNNTNVSRNDDTKLFRDEELQLDLFGNTPWGGTPSITLLPTASGTIPSWERVWG